MSRAPSAVVACVLLALGAPAAAQQPQVPVAPNIRPQAKEHVDKAEEHFKTKDYASAITALQAAYDLDPQRDLLYALAQATRLAGDCPAALKLYRKFLDEQPPHQEAEAAQRNIERCAELLAAQQAERERRAVAAVAAARAQKPPPEPIRPPWHRDTIGNVLLISGLTATAAGGGFFLWARSERDAARRAGTYAEVDAHRMAAERRHRIALVGLVAGPALVVSSLVRYALRGNAEPPAVVTAWVGGGGRGLGLALAF